MNKTTRLSLIIAAAVLVVAVIGIATWLMLRQPAPVINAAKNQGKNTTRTTSITNSSADQNSNSTPTTQNTATGVTLTDQQAITRVVTNFAERYGSYSTDTKRKNLYGLGDLMTEALATIITKQLNQQKLPDTFYSISTQVARVDIIDYAAGSTGATVTVVTRRTEKNGSVAPSSSATQSARAQLKKVSGTWKVDTFKWL